MGGWVGKTLSRMAKENQFGVIYLLGITERESTPEMVLVLDVNLRMFLRNKSNLPNHLVHLVQWNQERYPRKGKRAR